MYSELRKEIQNGRRQSIAPGGAYCSSDADFAERNPLWLCSSSQKSESERNTENGRGRKQKSRITEKAY
ncbi:MAG: hypothetical protein ACLRVD_00040 [Blautia caecimuris]